MDFALSSTSWNLVATRRNRNLLVASIKLQKSKSLLLRSSTRSAQYRTYFLPSLRVARLYRVCEGRNLLQRTYENARCHTGSHAPMPPHRYYLSFLARKRCRDDPFPLNIEKEREKEKGRETFAHIYILAILYYFISRSYFDWFNRATKIELRRASMFLRVS